MSSTMISILKCDNKKIKKLSPHIDDIIINYTLNI